MKPSQSPCASISVWRSQIFANGAIGPWIDQGQLHTGRDGFPAIYQVSGAAVVTLVVVSPHMVRFSAPSYPSLAPGPRRTCTLWL